MTMRDDLLHAQASVDWAVAQFPSLAQRIDSWLKFNIEVAVEDPDPSVPNNVIVAVEKEPLPLALNVAVGAYINAIRSSLDILATSLAYRYRIGNPDKTYFPIVESESIFNGGKFKGAKFIKGLPKVERTAVELLKPYKGGNELLWPLHQLDIMRKHRRLIGVEATPQTFMVSGWGDSITPVATGWMRANNKTVLALVRKDAPKAHVRFTPEVTIYEADLVERKGVIKALNQFASLADSIIKLFDS